MKQCVYKLIIIISICTIFNALAAEWLPALDNEFLNTDPACAPISAWGSAGSNAVIDSPMEFKAAI